MKIYELDFELDEFENFKPLVEWDLDKIQSFDGRPQECKDVEVVRLESEKERPLSDAPGFYAHIPLFSDKAKEVLEKYLSESGELIKATNDEGLFWIFNIVNVIDCIDHNRSKFKMFPDNKRILRFIQYCFNKEAIAGENIFKIKDDPLSNPFVSDEFKSTVEQAQLTGFQFKLVWDSEEL